MSVNIQTSSGLVKIAGTPTIDTALSNVSKNPVQNKVVTEKFDEINNNLAQLEFGEESGSGNLCDEEFILGYFNDKGQEFPSTNDIRTKNYIKVKPNTTYYLAGNDVVVVKLNESKTPIGYILWRKSNVSFTTDDNTHYIGLARPGVTTYSNDIAIIEGASGSYVPYIPSVKMLAEEVSAQNDSLNDIEFLGWSVPKECPIQNYVDSDGVFHQRVGRVDLGSFSWNYFSQNRFFASGIKDLVKKSTSDNEVMNGLYCNLYTKITSKNSLLNYDNSIACDDSGNIWIRNTSYTDAETFKNSLKGVYLYYELATEIKTNVDGNEAVTKVNDSLDGIKSDLFDVKANMSHNIPRTIPKDITLYYNDGTIWKRLNGTDGFSKYEDIFVGDYFKMSRAISAYNQDQNYQLTGSDWVTIAGISTLLGNGDTGISYEHLVMVPGKGFGGTQHFGRSRMNPTNTTVGGYVGSEMHTTTIGEVVSSGSTVTTATINQQLYAEFGSHLKTTRELLSNSLNSTGYNRFGEAGGCSNNWGWYDCQAVLMSEIELYGSIVWSSSGYDTGIAKMQLPLFANNRQAMNNRSSWYWLKDVASASIFCVCGSGGGAYYSSAGNVGSCVRPRFVIAA